ncbi:MMPL domain-containing drug exporter [Streptococcus gallolyticus]|uniref:MMPL domain-containing drug exporter n=2 Tax=Streptococcus TaxID=1301 RepID=A0A380K4B7_9STRE|nr:MMPL domain-containing drug exporter [Streptococcus gallolyticus]
MKGTESQTPLNIVEKDFAGLASKGASEKVVFKATSGSLTDKTEQQAMADFVKEEMLMMLLRWLFYQSNNKI